MFACSHDVPPAPRIHAAVPGGMDVPQPPPDVIPLPPSPYPVPPAPEVPPEIIDPVPPGGREPVRDPGDPGQPRRSMAASVARGATDAARFAGGLAGHA